MILLSVVHVILRGDNFLHFLELGFSKCLFVAFGSCLFARAVILNGTLSTMRSRATLLDHLLLLIAVSL